MYKLTDVTSIIISIFAVGALLAGLILSGQSGIKGEIAGIRGDVVDLQQRTARIEGQLALLMEAWNIDMPSAPDSAN
ncbi:MAG: hypothetical protein OXE97_07780 [Gammaproteobacteria bacterium]|nr:hypothetical protein [Gammaproteobacteria bacterium]MCY4210925.1 hypothetical protein [Gammaproteobacteria bacterium]MCY4282278.1 hypothetical protein [Gammaproteobacteria bacterium]